MYLTLVARLRFHSAHDLLLALHDRSRMVSGLSQADVEPPGSMYIRQLQHKDGLQPQRTHLHLLITSLFVSATAWPQLTLMATTHDQGVE